jgi:hypothetical protein
VGAVAVYVPTVVRIRSSRMLPFGDVIIREVKPLPAPFVTFCT